MKAKFAKLEVFNGKNYGYEKELVGAYTVLGKINGEMKEIITARSYMGRSRNASVVYASIWVNSGLNHCAGHGSAGGHGYHKESAAFQDAIHSAGIELYGTPYASARYDSPAEARKAAKRRAYIGGCGDDSMRAAFEAIARAAGAKGKLIYVQH